MVILHSREVPHLAVGALVAPPSKKLTSYCNLFFCKRYYFVFVIFVDDVSLYFVFLK